MGFNREMKYLCGILLLTCLPVAAQVSGRVSGAVVDAGGAPVPNADVSLLLAGGSRPLLKTKTAPDGTYNMIGVRPAVYDLTVEAPGFVKGTVHLVTVDAARETAVPQVKLQLASVTFKVDVNAAEVPVDVSNAEVSETITMQQIQNLPILDRDVLALMQLKPGVISNGNTATVINGLRTSYSDMTLDGVNVQDNYIRDNALDFTPNQLKIGQVAQMTLITSNANSAAGGGATQTAMATPSGTNQTHGDLFWYNRNNAFAANDWFNNQSGVDLPRLNQNQFGGHLAGHIKKDKLFYYASYEGLRAHAQQPQVLSILTADARNGIFTYNSGGTARKVNLLSLRGLNSVDSSMQAIMAQIPGPDKINFLQAGDGRNYGGYRFNQRDNSIQDNITGKIDYNLSTKNAFSGTYAHNRWDLDRPDASNNYGPVPAITNPLHSDLMALSWRWTPNATLTNELLGGFNLTYGYFLSSATNVPYIIAGTLFTDPVNEFQPQGRTTNTYNISDNAQWQHGKHFISFGFQFQHIGVESYDAAGVIPTFTLGLGSGQSPLTRRDLAGVSNADLNVANALLATVGGFVDGASQTFNVTSRTSGFVNGAPYLRHLLLNNYAFYLQDRFKIAPRLTLNIGLRYELPGVTDERDSLALAPVLQGSAVQTLLANAKLDFAGASAGRPWYNRETREFAPNIGLAWDVFGNGRTAFRAGYAYSYVNDQAILAPETLLEINNGLQATSADVGFSNRVSTGLPKITVPTFQVPRNFSDNFDLDPVGNAEGMIDPTLRRPHVQQYHVGIQHEIKGTVLEARYVGNHVVGAFRAFDFNQVLIHQNGWLADFQRAQNNGFLAQNATGAFNPAFNPNIPGSQPLQLFGKLAKGALTDGNAQFYLQTGEVGQLAYYYQAAGYNPTNAVPFFNNQFAYGTDLLTNYSSSSYNSLQVEARRRLKGGLAIEGNYTYSKVLSDADGDSQSRLQHFLDLANPRLERSRANYDLTHMIKADGSYDLPFGKGHRLSSKRLNRVIGGWTVGSIMVWQSGAPFSILSGRGTYNRSSRSYYNGANTALTKPQIDNLVHFQMTGNGPMIVAQSAINKDDGTGVNTDGEAPFTGQVFFNPAAGTIGGLQKRMFSGPWTFDLDARLKKAIQITESKKLYLDMLAINCLNHATFWSGDQNINSPAFGVVPYTFYPPRILQFGLHLSF